MLLRAVLVLFTVLSASAQIRVGPATQERKLVYAPEPEYPARAREARIQGTVRFNVLIGEDGTVKKIRLVGGHPLLIGAARETVVQYRYEPTLWNGAPVEVITIIDVNFVLGTFQWAKQNESRIRSGVLYMAMPGMGLRCWKCSME
jgi:TonB family protein